MRVAHDCSYGLPAAQLRVPPAAARARPAARRVAGLANRARAAYGPPRPHADAERRRPHARGTGRSGDRRAERSAIALAAVHAQPPVQGAPAHRGQRQGHALPLARRPRDFGQLGGPVVRQSRPLPSQGRRGGAKGRRDPRLRADLPVRPQQGVRARLAGRRRDAGRPEPRVLRQLGLGGGRHRAQDRARLSPGARRGPAHPPDRPRARLSRRRLRRHLGRRHGRQPAHLRADAAGRRPSAPHPGPGAQRVLARPARMGRPSRRRPGAPVRAARPLDHRSGDRRAGGGLGRRLSAAQGLSRAPARDLRPARHPADLRRGDHRLGPARLRVGRRAHGHHARPHDHGQGPDQRACADGRRGLPRAHLRSLHEGAGARHRAVPRLHLQRPSGGGRRRRRQPSRPTRRRASSSGCSRSSPTSRTRCTPAATCRACATSAISA